MPSRKFSEASPILYGRYDCGHGEWLELTDGEVPEETYAGGYLPYARQPGNGQHLFYMGRSLRVDLSSCCMGKKRRYEHRQWQAFGLRRHHLDKSTFLERFGDRAVSLAREWMQTRFGVPYLDEAEFKDVLAKPFVRDILTWELDGSLVAFSLVVKGGWGAHYWFAFYRGDGAVSQPPGHGYMGDFLDWTREEGLPYAYLGTSYGLKSRYKSKGLCGIEFWDGKGWNTDRNRLAELLHQDDSTPPAPGATVSDAAERPYHHLV